MALSETSASFEKQMGDSLVWLDYKGLTAGAGYVTPTVLLPLPGDGFDDLALRVVQPIIAIQQEWGRMKQMGGFLAKSSGHTTRTTNYHVKVKK